MLRRDSNDSFFKAAGISPLQTRHRFIEQMFAIGNDPCMSDEAAKYHVADEQIALIATSGLRALSLACHLGNQTNTPRIFIIDVNQSVCKFWMAVKELFASCETEEEFKLQLPEFLKQYSRYIIPLNDDLHDSEYPQKIKYESQNIPEFFSSLFTKFNYSYVRSAAVTTKAIHQCMLNTDCLLRLKAQIHAAGVKKIFIYASNIAACLNQINPTQVDTFLENIRALEPVVAIHTDLSRKYEIPKYAYFLECSDPDFVKRKIFHKQYTPDSDTQLQDNQRFNY